MTSSADRPQIGPVDVDPAALRQEGSDLDVALASLGLESTAGAAAGTPIQGWRVLRGDTTSGLVLGAPVDERGEAWRIAQVRPARDGAGSPSVTVHPDTFPLRPSRAERSRGLALRWPEVTRSEPDLDRLAIDVINTGDSRWRPNGDSFHVVGTLQRQGEKQGAYFFAFVGGADPAFPLDAGEYVRVRVTIDANQWRDLQPGRYQLNATLAQLGVRAESPLELELTEELIERHRPRPTRSGPPTDQRPAMMERLEMIRGLLAARENLGALVEIITTASSDDDARQNIQELLDCPPSVADAIYSAPLRRFQTTHPDHLIREADDLERAIDQAPSDEERAEDGSDIPDDRSTHH